MPVSVHTAEGEPLDLSADGASRPASAFALTDDELDGYVALDFGAFDAWYEEDELNVSHPRDPFHRIEVVHSCTACAYKGQASYLSLPDVPDIASTYTDPLREAAEVKDRIAFFNEHVDPVIDGRPIDRPITPWSKR